MSIDYPKLLAYWMGRCKRLEDESAELSAEVEELRVQLIIATNGEKDG